MKSLDDENQILDLIDMCYQSVDRKDVWKDLIYKTANFVGADAGDLTIENHVDELIDVYGSFGFDPYYRENYDEAFFGKNPWILQCSKLPTCRAFNSEFEPRDFEKTAFFAEWLKPQGLRHGLGSTLEHSPLKTVHLGFIRNARRAQFGESEAAKLDRLLPHFGRAVQLADRLGKAGLEKDNLKTVLNRFVAPILLTDELGGLVLPNSAAERLLSDGEFVRLVRRNRVSFTDQSADETFRHHLSIDLKQRATDGGESSHQFPLRGAEENILIVTMAPVRMQIPASSAIAHFIVVINDPTGAPTADSSLLRKVYSLTDAESSLASALAGGADLAAYSIANGIRIGTVRWHLKNIQSKTGIHRLDRLMALFKSILCRPLI
ncbi:hypothetical protein CSC94_08980 [Zhengella mangrovi]|uniref:HTH luxR-type domain-containing protein n=1 Tax=Zhengella mangrovi TaxID=1982044 RepID=A0A2G1QQP6_9HYPH|nr:hypothetical protein CSC94_08980 [Zhengella mangrovi]